MTPPPPKTKKEKKKENNGFKVQGFYSIFICHAYINSHWSILVFLQGPQSHSLDWGDKKESQVRIRRSRSKYTRKVIKKNKYKKVKRCVQVQIHRELEGVQKQTWNSAWLPITKRQIAPLLRWGTFGDIFRSFFFSISLTEAGSDDITMESVKRMKGTKISYEVQK